MGLIDWFRSKMIASTVPTMNKLPDNPMISVVMASYLEDYEGGASDRETKFVRAIESFAKQTYENKELVIVADGCNKTGELVREHSKKLGIAPEHIELLYMEKQPLFSGKIRDMGLKAAKGDLISYLDSDDKFGNNHLKSIVAGFRWNPELFWVYFNDLMYYPDTKGIVRNVELELASVGTSSIAHRNLPEISWKGCDGYNHDWKFIQRLMQLPKYEKIFGCEYYVCHVPNQFER